VESCSISSAHRWATWLTLACALVCSAVLAAGPPVPVAPADAEQWLRWLSPLPKQITMAAKRVVPRSAVRIRVARDGGAVERFAAERLRGILQPGAEDTAPAGGYELEIILGVCDDQGRVEGNAVPGAPALQNLPNREQAYVIAPQGENQLVVAALDPRGVSHGATTLGQLLTARLADGTVEVPLVIVTDWPDLAERGLWWFGPYPDRALDWLAEVKLNHLEVLAALHVAKGTPATATLSTEAVAQSRLRAIQMMPVIKHLEQCGAELVAAYPETQGKAEPVPGVTVLCFSQPATQRALDEWCISLARTVDSDDLMVWLAEGACYCACEQCQKIEHWHHEVQAVLHAWNAARAVRPNLRLRVLWSQDLSLITGTPPEVGFSFYHWFLTYTFARTPMIAPELRNAMQGRWFGCYPTLGAYGPRTPFSGAAYMRERFGELHQAGVVSVAGFTPSLRAYDLALSAAAEYGWNTTGRPPREFVLSWATRQRIQHPERVVQWWELVEEPQRDFLISYLGLEDWGAFHHLLTARQAAQPGAGILTGFPQPSQLDDDIAALRRALPLAEAIEPPRFAHETRATLALLEALRALRELTAYLADHTTPAEAETREAASRGGAALALLRQAGDHLTAWDHSLELYPGQVREAELGDAVEFVGRIRTHLEESLGKLGLAPR
jgi:hypothetical protein